jgi:hypothetical protein
MDLYYFANVGCQVAEKSPPQPQTVTSPGLVVVAVENFDSETYYFPPRNEVPELPSVTITDLNRGTIQFAILRS